MSCVEVTRPTRKISHIILIVHIEGCGSEKKGFRALTEALDTYFAGGFHQPKACNWITGMKKKGILITRSIGSSWNQLYIKDL
jgi:hypothetical protein